MRCDAKPAPPSVVMSRVPWKQAVVVGLAEEGDVMVRWDCVGWGLSGLQRWRGRGVMGNRAYLGGAAADPVVACGPVGGCPGAEVVVSEWMRVKRGWDGVEGFGEYLLPPNRKS